MSKSAPIAAIILLLVILHTNFVRSARDEIANKKCTITEDGDGKSFVYLSSILLAVKYQRYSTPESEAKWLVKPVQIGGKTYYELKNVKRDEYMAGHNTNGIYGTKKPYSKSDDESTLWEISPAQQDVPVTFKNYKYGYLQLPKGSGSYMRLSKISSNKWNFKCT